ncbi:MAG: hypothetical protein II786_06900 [Muribaculaceae bacterium]|nr:hypothetical protein [Muribaculaceae bacterium]
MKPLLVDISFPSMRNDMTIARAQIEQTGKLPPMAGLAPDVVLDIEMCYVLHLMLDRRSAEASLVVDSLVYDDNEDYRDIPPLYAAWLWLVHMTLLVESGDHVLALSSAENALYQLSTITGKKSDNLLALLASLLYNLAIVHHNTGEDSRAAKELTRAQKLLERLAKKDEARYTPMLLTAIEASTQIITSRTKQMNVLAHYQTMSELYTSQLESGDANATREAMAALVDTLKKEGDIMLDMGNGRNAVKYYTKALRYQKKLSGDMGQRELTLSIGLAKALMRLINRRAAAEQLLNSLLPLARRLNANAEMKEIQNLLNNKNKNFNIMNLIKSIFVFAVICCSAITAQAQLIVGHRGSMWGVENTRAAFVNGARAGAWGLECDIHTTADGTFVVCHDSNTKRIGGTEDNFASLTTAQSLAIPLTQTRRGITYAGHLMTLAEYLDVCNEQQVVPVVEIKWSTNIHTSDKSPQDNTLDGVPALINLLKQKGCLDRVVIISFMSAVIEYIHLNYPEVKVQVLAGDGDIEQWVDWCIARNIDLDVAHNILTQAAVDRLHRAGLKVNVWTVDDPTVFSRLQDWGVDFITTNAIFPKELK